MRVPSASILGLRTNRYTLLISGHKLDRFQDTINSTLQVISVTDSYVSVSWKETDLLIITYSEAPVRAEPKKFGIDKGADVVCLSKPGITNTL